MSIKTLTLAFAAGLLASQAYARLQQSGALAATGSSGADEFDDEPTHDWDTLSPQVGDRPPSESLGAGVLGEEPGEATEPYRANDAQLFGSNASESERPRMVGIPDLTRGA